MKKRAGLFYFLIKVASLRMWSLLEEIWQLSVRAAAASHQCPKMTCA